MAGRVRSPGVVIADCERGSAGACAKYEPGISSTIDESRLMATPFNEPSSFEEPASCSISGATGKGSGDSRAAGVGAADPGMGSNVETRNEPDSGRGR